MVTGSLAAAGYFMGRNLWPGNLGNPKGLYEDREVNSINESLLAPVLPGHPRWLPAPRFIRNWLWPDRLKDEQRWLARVPTSVEITATEQLADRIRALTQSQPFCFKDPRFSYTLPAWRPFIADAAFVCVFRSPSATANSILKECQDAHYLQGLRMTREWAIDTWFLMYRHILDIHRHQGSWLFLHYNQVLHEDGLHRLGEFIQATRVDTTFPEAALKRSADDHHDLPHPVRSCYEELCTLAGYTDHLRPPTAGTP